jgi:hypothetical protein
MAAREGFSVHLASTEFLVAPGQAVSVPVLINNESGEDRTVSFGIQGVPSNWVSVPSPLVHLAPGERREMALAIQPPAFPQARAGRHSLVVRVMSQQDPAEAVEKTCTLTVAALEAPGRIGVLLAATEFPVVPGSSTTIPLVLLNRGLDADTFALSVAGIPSAWVYAPAVTLSLAPGQQQEVMLSIQPPPSAQIEAGRHPFRIQVSSQGTPGQAAEVVCALAIAAFGGFRAELRPQRVEAGQPARVLVENQGNIQQDFTVGWQSPGGEVIFQPGEAQQLRVPPGEVGMIDFRPAPRSRPFLGGEMSLPFTTRVQTPDRQSQNLTGEVVTRGLLPAWVLPAVGIAILALIAAIVLIALLGSGGSATLPTNVPATEAPPAVETAVPPDEAPPAVETEAPPEAPTEAPAIEAPPEAPPGEAAQLPANQPAPTKEPPAGSGGAGLPCLPAAFGLMFVPLLVRSRRSARKELGPCGPGSHSGGCGCRGPAVDDPYLPEPGAGG